jgi:hypothetical protein
MNKITDGTMREKRRSHLREHIIDYVKRNPGCSATQIYESIGYTSDVPGRLYLSSNSIAMFIRNHMADKIKRKRYRSYYSKYLYYLKDDS